MVNEDVYKKSLPGHANNEERDPDQTKKPPVFDFKDFILEHRYELKEWINGLPKVQRFMAKQFIAMIVPKEDRGAVFGFLNDGNNDGSGSIEGDGDKDKDRGYPSDRYIPDPKIDDEIREFATSRFLSGVRWGEIADELLLKYDVDYHPMTVREIVQRGLIWSEKNKASLNQGKELVDAKLEISELKSRISRDKDLFLTGLMVTVVGVLSFILGRVF